MNREFDKFIGYEKHGNKIEKENIEMDIPRKMLIVNMIKCNLKLREIKMANLNLLS